MKHIIRKRKINPRNYLNNIDMMIEIHNSKKTYCFFIEERYSDYNLILSSKNDIFLSSNIFKAYENETGLVASSFEEITKTGINSLVFRVMTFEHIPPTYYGKKRTVVLNFPPFKHFVIDNFEHKVIKEVGRSHWKGTLSSGCFSMSHGRITDKLGSIIMKLANRYSQKSNWRGYTWNTDMVSHGIKQLCEAALKFDERKSNNPFAYYSCILSNTFKAFLNSEKRLLEIRDELMIQEGFDPSYNYQIKYEQQQKKYEELGITGPSLLTNRKRRLERKQKTKKVIRDTGSMAL